MTYCAVRLSQSNLPINYRSIILIRTSAFGVVAAIVVSVAACDSTTLSSPRTPGGPSFAKGGGGPSCSISLPAPNTRPLPAVREVARELNEAFGKSSSQLSCGAINSVDQRFNKLVSFLDLAFEDQKLDAACGIATGLSDDLEAWANQGLFNPIVTHPPQASNNVVENMQFITSQFCANAGH
jgi:hypothetical protein